MADQNNGTQQQRGPAPTTNSPVEKLTADLEALKKQVAEVAQKQAARDTQQLNYPLDFTSQQIILGFVSSPGPSFFSMSGVRGFGLYYGAGSPNTVVKAAKGSLYLNWTGSSTSTRAYINTDGATAWAAVTTAS